jgi:hypothetical protein
MNFVGFIMIGAVYTFFSEQVNVNLYRSWVYNESMPIIPWTGVGLLPVVQWMVVPIFTILILRHYCLLVQRQRKNSEAKGDLGWLKPESKIDSVSAITRILI